MKTETIEQDAVWAMHTVIHLRSMHWYALYGADNEGLERAMSQDMKVQRARAFLASMMESV